MEFNSHEKLRWLLVAAVCLSCGISGNITYATNNITEYSVQQTAQIKGTVTVVNGQISSADKNPYYYTKSK